MLTGMAAAIEVFPERDELEALMFEYEGFPSTEWPIDWVRSLMRENEWRPKAA